VDADFRAPALDASAQPRKDKFGVFLFRHETNSRCVAPMMPRGWLVNMRGSVAEQQIDGKTTI
jgi:hypothetical protein